MSFARSMHQPCARSTAWPSQLPLSSAWHRSSQCLRHNQRARRLNTNYPAPQQPSHVHFGDISTGQAGHAYIFPALTASEISRGLSNADLHLRQHYEERINWDADKEESRAWRRTVSEAWQAPAGSCSRGNQTTQHAAALCSIIHLPRMSHAVCLHTDVHLPRLEEAQE